MLIKKIKNEIVKIKMIKKSYIIKYIVKLNLVSKYYFTIRNYLKIV